MDQACTHTEVSSNSSSSPAIGFLSPTDFLFCVRLDGKLGGRVLNTGLFLETVTEYHGVCVPVSMCCDLGEKSPDVVVCVSLCFRVL